MKDKEPNPIKNRAMKAFIPNRLPKHVGQSKDHCRKSMMLNPHDGSLILLVDFKDDPNLSAKLLNKSLTPLKPYLSKVVNGKLVKGDVTILVSGNRPKKNNLFFEEEPKEPKLRRKSSLFRGGSVVEEDANRNVNKPLFQRFVARGGSASNVEETRALGTRYLFLDGRIKDLDTEQDSVLIPLVSFDWRVMKIRHLLRRNGDEFIEGMTNLAHSQGKRMRVWGVPNTERSWVDMLRKNVDWLSVDNHERFSKFAKNEGTGT
jgi:hypothetical protein